MSTCCVGPMERVPYWAPMDFFSGQGFCVLCWQSVVQMGRYTQALGAVSDSWRLSCVLMDEDRGGSIRRRWVNGVVVCIYAKMGFIVHYILLLGRSLQASYHCLYICWQCRFILEVVVAQPSLFVHSKVSGNCFTGDSVHRPWILRVHERAEFSGTFLSLAGEVCADLLGQVSWEDVCCARLRIPQVEHSHGL